MVVQYIVKFLLKVFVSSLKVAQSRAFEEFKSRESRAFKKSCKWRNK